MIKNLVFSQINTDVLISEISKKVTADVVDAVTKMFNNSQGKKEILNINEASELLGLTVPTIYSKVSLKELPNFKKGNRLYFRRSELLEYIESGRKLTTYQILKNVESDHEAKRKGAHYEKA